MEERDELLQKRIERLEAGEPLEACLDELPAEEAELLRLVSTIRDARYPALSGDAVAAQRVELLRQARKENEMKDRLFAKIRLTWRSWLDWLLLQPKSRLRWAAAGLIVVLLATAGGVALGGRRPQPARLTPENARLEESRGVVEIQTGNGPWSVARPGQIIVAGQGVRTGALSSTKLTFNDGSQVTLGPKTEITLDDIEAPSSDGSRTIVLTQKAGSSDHNVIPSTAAGSRYEVRTPAGTGEAKGTCFHVTVVSDRFARFGVDEGSVAVTNLDSTVQLQAGQSTTVPWEAVPGEPAFRMSGEGEVGQIGEVWIIGGQSFQPTESTIIIGNPQVGDWVSVEGRILADGTHVADLIVLLQRSPVNRFTLTGRVEQIGDTGWIVTGQAISVTAETEIEEGILVGDLVRVEGVVTPGPALVAERIMRVHEEPGMPFEFVGVVEQIADEQWTISGVPVVVDDETVIDEGLMPGDLVEVWGWIRDDGSWLAHSIERVLDDERAFEFTGEVESMAPWVVAGIPFEVRDWTQIEPGTEVGDLVRVTGQITEDGTWVAAEIERIDEDDSSFRIILVGVVASMDPWVVGNFPLVVTGETVIIGDVQVGSLVKVEIEILPDGSWLAKTITLIEPGWGLGCWTIAVYVLGIEGNQLQVIGWSPIDLGGVPVEGELQPNSVVQIIFCMQQDGTVTIISIIVIVPPGIIIIVPPVVPITPPDDGDKVIICHKGQTITVSRSALPAHQEHGDTIGSCP